MTKPFRTVHLPDQVSPGVSKAMYEYILKNTPWTESIRSRTRGFTRMGCSVGEDDIIFFFVASVLTGLPEKIEVPNKVVGIYLNHYRDGKDWCPRHNHRKSSTSTCNGVAPGTIQMIISLGATRKLTVGKKEYPLGDGDVILFGGSLHGIEPEPEIKEGRISIAVFLERE